MIPGVLAMRGALSARTARVNAKMAAPAPLMHTLVMDYFCTMSKQQTPGRRAAAAPGGRGGAAGGSGQQEVATDLRGTVMPATWMPRRSVAPPLPKRG